MKHVNTFPSPNAGLTSQPPSMAETSRFPLCVDWTNTFYGVAGSGRETKLLEALGGLL